MHTGALRARASVEPGREAPATVAGSGEMFDAIAPRYDLLNRVLSFGLDRRWRRRTVDAMQLNPRARVLDVATGTGDLALEVAKRGTEVEVVGVDPSVEMLARARCKVARRADAGLSSRLVFQEGDAQRLPFEDSAFDAAGIAFGIRNVPDRCQALRELDRVVRPGGRVVILELSEPRGILARPARFYLHALVPRIGGWLSGRREYRYLQKSIEAFPRPVAFAQLMEGAGLEVLGVRPFAFGACHLFVACAAAQR